MPTTVPLSTAAGSTGTQTIKRLEQQRKELRYTNERAAGTKRKCASETRKREARRKFGRKEVGAFADLYVVAVLCQCTQDKKPRPTKISSATSKTGPFSGHFVASSPSSTSRRLGRPRLYLREPQKRFECFR